MVVDASHPYAAVISENCQEVCRSFGIIYLRYERPEATLPEYSRLFQVSNYEQAAKLAAGLGQVIFLTIGSHNLAYFTKEPLLGRSKLIARVLPELAVLAECGRIGFGPDKIIAMQGPFSQGLNMEMFKAVKAEVLVTKNSGLIGGGKEKFAATTELGMSIIVIARPSVVYSIRCLRQKQY